MNWTFLIGPIVGGVIGYITNSIAIKMLFRPLKPVYLFGMKLPFTPGMIPREQERIAKTIGEVVGKELIDETTLKSHLLSQEMVVKLEKVFDDWLFEMQKSEASIGEALHDFLGDTNMRLLMKTVEEDLTQGTYKKIVEMNLGEPFAKQAVEAISSSLGPMSALLGKSMMDMAEHKLEGIIQKMIEERGEDVIESIITKEKDKLLHMPVAELMEKIQDESPKIKYMILNQYVHLVENQLTKMIQTIDITQIVEDKIRNYNVREMETMILGIVNKELNAIVWLGALLGAVMGIIMNFF